MQKTSLLPSPRRLVTALIILLAAAALAAYALLSSPQKLKGSGEALIGGPFTMVDQHGNSVTQNTYLGKPMLLLFGFTSCPDVCPAELQVTSEALQQLGSKAQAIQLIFVSIDPERDTPKVMAEYVANFSPNLIGLTGSPEQVAGMAAAYHVYYEKKLEGNSLGDYSMDHSSIIYLMGSDGKFLKHFSYTTDAKALAEAIAAAFGL